MKKDDFSPDLYFRELYKNVPRPFEKAGEGDVEGICRNIRNEAKRLFSEENIPDRCNVSYKVLCSEKRSNYTVKTISAEICTNLNMLCYLLVPDKMTGMGVVAVPGHGYGVRQIIRQGKNGKYRAVNFIDNYQKNFALELALRGNTVIAFEPVGFGRARLIKDSKKPFYISSCETLSMHSLMYGFSVASLRIYQAKKCVDILEGEGLSRFGIMGISGGGLVSLYTSLVDERIERTVVSGYINSFRDSVFSMWHCPDNYMPGLINTGDMSDFAAALAPKRLLMECGERDKLFPFSASEKAIEKIRTVYKLSGAEDKFVCDMHKGKHEVSGRLSFDFFSLEEQ